jgi:hypothetical protein
MWQCTRAVAFPVVMLMTLDPTVMFITLGNIATCKSKKRWQKDSH